MALDVGKVGMVMKGDWSSSATYEELDAVSYNNGLYVAKQAVPANTAPTNTVYWQNAINPATLAFVPAQEIEIAANIPTAEELGNISWSGAAQVINFVNSSYIRSLFIGAVRENGTSGAGLIISYYGDKLYYARVSSGTWTITALNIL